MKLSKFSAGKKLQSMIAKLPSCKKGQTASDQLRIQAGRGSVLGFQIAQSETGQLPSSRIIQTASGQSTLEKILQTLSAKSSADEKGQSMTGQFPIPQSVTGKLTSSGLTRLCSLAQCWSNEIFPIESGSGINTREYQIYLPSKEILRKKLEEWA